MHILLSNDDGIEARGLRVLAQVAAGVGTVTTVAPAEDMSAISHAITLRHPLRMHRRSDGRYAVRGTPTDCVYLGLHKILKDDPPDLVLSGINRGPNLGIDVLYSGTVAAAMEGAHFGVPAVAFSLATFQPTEESWRTAGRVAAQVLEWLSAHPLPAGRLLNVNIPAGPLADPAPLVVTRLGRVTYPGTIEERHDPRGHPYYWIAGYPPVYDEAPDSDCTVVHRGAVSITPLNLDLTDDALRRRWASREDEV